VSIERFVAKTALRNAVHPKAFVYHCVCGMQRVLRRVGPECKKGRADSPTWTSRSRVRTPSCIGVKEISILKEIPER
jgi:hypothetical protein